MASQPENLPDLANSRALEGMYSLCSRFVLILPIVQPLLKTPTQYQIIAPPTANMTSNSAVSQIICPSE